MKRQVHVFYSGRVQGVGFRFTTEDIASDLEVCGWVKNLRDGRVEVVAESEEEKLGEFLERIKKCFNRYIQDIDLKWQDETSGFKDFRIEF